MTVDRPVLAGHVRYRWDRLRGQHQLVFPEGLLILNETAAAIVKSCDGRTLADLIAHLNESFPGECRAADVPEFLDRLAKRGLLRNAADS